MVELSVAHTPKQIHEKLKKLKEDYLQLSQTSLGQFEYIFQNYEVQWKHAPQILPEKKDGLEDVIGLVLKSLERKLWRAVAD